MVGGGLNPILRRFRNFSAVAGRRPKPIRRGVEIGLKDLAAANETNRLKIRSKKIPFLYPIKKKKNIIISAVTVEKELFIDKQFSLDERRPIKLHCC